MYRNMCGSLSRKYSLCFLSKNTDSISLPKRVDGCFLSVLSHVTNLRPLTFRVISLSSLLFSFLLSRRLYCSVMDLKSTLYALVAENIYIQLPIAVRYKITSRNMISFALVIIKWEFRLEFGRQVQFTQIFPFLLVLFLFVDTSASNFVVKT